MTNSAKVVIVPTTNANEFACMCQYTDCNLRKPTLIACSFALVEGTRARASSTNGGATMTCEVLLKPAGAGKRWDTNIRVEKDGRVLFEEASSGVMN